MSTNNSRAYALAEMWANDPTRLAELLVSEMTPELWAELCDDLAIGFIAYSDEGLSHHSTRSECLRSVMHMHALVVEKIFLPLAEQIVKIETRSAAEQYESAVRVERAELRLAA